MPIDPRISLGVQPLQVADPMATYSQLAGIQNAQNQNALAQYQLSAAQRADEQQNKLYAAAQKPDFKLDFQSAIQYGAPGIAAFKAQQEASNAQTEGQIKDTKLLTDKLALLPEAYKRADTPEAYLALHQSIHADPVLGPWLKSTGATPEKGLATLQNAIQTGNFEKLRMGSMQSVSQILDSMKPTVVPASSSVYNPDTKTFTQAPAAPEKPVTQTELVRNFEFAKTPAGGNYRGSFADFKAISTPKTTNVFGKQEAAFESGLGKGQSDRILANQVVAQDAAAILETNQVGRDLLKSGAIVGTGADFFVGFNNALKQAGIDFGYADAAANSQAYAAAMGANVGRIIKQFGAGTGLSDADRDYAAQMAGGKINLTESALRKILDINDKAANRVIDLHNKNVSGIKTNIPLTVDKPTFTQQKSAVDQIPGQSRSVPAPAATIPQAAIDALKAGKGTDAQFDAVFGTGAAKRARGGK